MSKVAVIIGATGEVGKNLVTELTNSSEISSLIILTRRKISFKHPKISENIINFEEIEKLNLPRIDLAYCCLGTTIKKAKSKSMFKKVDVDYVYEFAKLVKQHECENFNLVSAINADSNSRSFYGKCKGEAEDLVESLEFKSINIYRPGLLNAKRKEFRIAEEIGLKLMNFTRSLIPVNYRDINVSQVAKAMKHYSFENLEGKNIFKNSEMFKV